jgi:hypothetical protein
MFCTLLRDELSGWLRQWKFSEVMFDGDLPERNGAQVNLVLRIANRRGTDAGNLASPDTSQRNSQVSSRILICLPTSA